MHALSMIDMGMKTSDAVAPAKPSSKNEQQFGKVLSEKHQTQSQHESKSANKQPDSTESSSDKQVIAHNHKTETKQETTGQKDISKKIVAENNTDVMGEVNPQQQVKVQHTLIDLMKTMTQGEGTENVESSDRIEMLLTDLVEQLESTELHGEQILAGVDLSALAAELQALNQEPNREELLAQLVTQVEGQLETGLLENGKLAAAMMTETQQQNVAPVMVETLAQARQLLQQVLDAVVTPKAVVAETVVATENVALAEQPLEENLFSMEETAEEIDPRFAGLLKPRTENRSTQQVQLHHPKQGVEANHSEVTVPVLPEEVVAATQSGEVSQHLEGTTKQVLENLAQLGSKSLQPQGQPLVQGFEANKVMAATPVVQLPSGQQVTESQIFDQVVTQLSGSISGESGRMVLRLQPVELGSLRLELTIEGDKVRANLHAQTQQVQEVLERNLPQLRSALAEQGLKIDQFQVNIDKNSDQQSQFENLSQQQQSDLQQRSDQQQVGVESEELNIPLAHLIQNGGGGISLHV